MQFFSFTRKWFDDVNVDLSYDSKIDVTIFNVPFCYLAVQNILKGMIELLEDQFAISMEVVICQGRRQASCLP